jgi:hypothetical protein
MQTLPNIRFQQPTLKKIVIITQKPTIGILVVTQVLLVMFSSYCRIFWRKKTCKVSTKLSELLMLLGKEMEIFLVPSYLVGMH